MTSVATKGVQCEYLVWELAMRAGWIHNFDVQALRLSLHTHRLQDGRWVEYRNGSAHLEDALASLQNLSSLTIDPPLALRNKYESIPFLADVVQQCLVAAPCLAHLRIGNTFKGFYRCRFGSLCCTPFFIRCASRSHVDRIVLKLLPPSLNPKSVWFSAHIRCYTYPPLLHLFVTARTVR